jgi:hypothetical protein
VSISKDERVLQNRRSPFCSALSKLTIICDRIRVGVFSAALGLAEPAQAATPSLDARNTAGVGLNTGGQEVANRKPTAGSKAASLNIFQDDNLG